MTLRRSLCYTCAVLVAGCAPDPPSSEPDSASADFVPVADVQQLMLTILEPAAEEYWDAVGWIVDTTGTTYIRPETLEDWEAVRNAAFVIAESGNLLLMEGRAIDDDAWTGMARAMIDVGERAIEVAEARDEQGVFDVGAEVYQSCTNCHVRYARETLRPNALPPNDP